MPLIRTLGTLSITEGDRLLAGSLAQPRRQALLAVLARAGERGVSRERLLALFWPDLPEERARPNLAQALYAIRRDLGGDETITGITDLRLDAQLVPSDVVQFERACQRGEWQAAVALYSGPFLDGVVLAGLDEFNRWADTERAALAHRQGEALEKLATASSDPVTAAGWWRRLAAHEPYSGRIALRLMQALVATGDRAGAIRHSQIHAELLRQELDTAPDPDVTDFAERLRQAPAADPRPRDIAPPTAAVAVAAIPSADVAGTPRAATTTHQRRYLFAGAVLVAVVALGLLLWRDRPAAPPVPGATSRVSADAVLELDPQVSPDGSRIAYVAGAVGSTRLHLRELAGGPPLAVGDTDLMPHRLPQWSADGSTIYFQGRGGIYRVGALGGVPRLIVRDDPALGRAMSPSLSRDGRRLAYVFDDRLVIRSLDDDSETIITAVPYPHSPAWSPDGRRLAVVSDNLAFVMGGAPPALVGTNLGNIGSSALWIVDVTGGREPVEIVAGSGRALSPTWAPDGRTLLYLSDQEGRRDIYMVAIGGNLRPVDAPRRITTGLGAHSIALSRDGSRLAYATFTNANNIYRVDIPASGTVSVRGAVPLTGGSQTVEGLAVSPDGQWLAFDSDLNGRQELWRMPATGGEAERLTTSTADNFLPAWSPNGRELAFYEFRDGRRRLRTVPSSGGRVRTVTGDEYDDRYPSWSPDGSQLMFARRLGPYDEIHTIRRNADSTWSEARQLTEEGGNAARWSPDGKHFLYFPGRTPGLAVAPIDRPGEVRLLVRGDSASGAPFPALAEWDPRGDRIYYKAFDGEGRASFWVVNVDGSGRRQLVRFDDPALPTSRPEFATDGRWLYFTVGQPLADVWVMAMTGEW